MRSRKVCLLCFIIMLLLCACSPSDATDVLDTVCENISEKLFGGPDELSDLRGIVEPIPEEERIYASEEDSQTESSEDSENVWKNVVRGEVITGNDSNAEDTEKTFEENENPSEKDSNTSRENSDTSQEILNISWEKGNSPLPEGSITEANSFCYNRLSEEDKPVYREILRGLLNLEIAELDPAAEDCVDRVFKCVIFDHPEIFYVFGYNCSKEYLGEELQRIYISGTMNMDLAEVQKRKQLIEEQVQGILNDMQDIQDSYEITKYLYRYIINSTEYDKHSVDNQNICSVFLNHRSVCSGYAKAFQYLMQRKGIQTGLIQGTVKDGNPHAWNMVLLDGEYYFVDVTWGDSSYNYEGQNESGVKIPGVLYDYLCVTTEELCKTHQIDSIVSIPVCVAEKNNYFRREGCYFTSIDEAALQQVFTRGYERQEATVIIKCANDSVYDGMVQYLIEEQKIFRYLQNANGTVSYAGNKDLNSITFWL